MIEHADFQEGVRVQQTGNSLPGGELALIMLFSNFFGSAHLPGFSLTLLKLFYFLVKRHLVFLSR